MATIERSFRIFRQSIYDESLQKLKELKKLSGEIKIDEALFGGHRKGSKRGWGAEGKTLVFGIYQRNGKVITFPISDRKQHDMLIPLIKLHTKKGSLYYTDDHTAYATLDLIGKHQIIAHGMEDMYVKILLLISMVLKDSGAMPRHGYIIIAVYRGNTFIFI